MTLKYIVKEPKKLSANTPLLILVHGYGSNEEDLFSFSGELPDEFLIISVRAPMETGFGGYAWYTIHFDNNNGKFSDIDEALAAREQLSEFIDEIQLKYNIRPNRTFLMGFSQGTILGYAVTMNYPQKVQKLIALSGYINPDLLPKELDKYDYSALDFFISHGIVDQVIPVQWASQAPLFLEELGIKHSYKEYPVGHGVAPANFYDLLAWIEERL